MSTKDAAIKIKLAKANALLLEVPMLIQFKYHSIAITRMYYSCFHATKALLLTKKESLKRIMQIFLVSLCRKE